jgi:hypothetical protein
MVSKDFKIKKNIFKKRRQSIIQHKLRVLMKCYTIVDFELDHDNNTFLFKKTHKINGLKMNDPKEYTGRFEVEDLEEDQVNLKLIVG